MWRPISLGTLPPDSAVGAVVPLILSPRLAEMPGFRQGNENTLIQAFSSQPAVEIFPRTIVCGFPGPAVFQATGMSLPPSFQGPLCAPGIVRKEPA